MSSENCTGEAATWCPACGDCTCTSQEHECGEYNELCPLHGVNSHHAMTRPTKQLPVLARSDCLDCGGSGLIFEFTGGIEFTLPGGSKARKNATRVLKGLCSCLHTEEVL